MKSLLIEYLEKEPRARERRFKDRACVNLLLPEYSSLQVIPKDVLVRFVQEYNSLDRAWRQTLEKNEHFRGRDYYEKGKLEDRKLKELGYNVNEETNS